MFASHPHYKLPSGKMISKKRVDEAMKLLQEITANGSELVYLTDEELFSCGDKMEAVMRFYKKHDTTALEAKDAIEFLRGENISPIF